MNFFLIVLLLQNIHGVFGAEGTDWGYEKSNGPDKWHGMCQTHSKQSPIDVRSPDVDYAHLDPLQFLNYDVLGDIELKNTGRTLIAQGFKKWGDRQPMIHGGGLNHRYKLEQFHFHWGQEDSIGSEHAIGGLHYPAELHLVHVREDLKLPDALEHSDGVAVVGVFIAKMNDRSGKYFSKVSAKFTHLKYSGNSSKIRQFKTKYVLPSNTEAFYRYDGSLTTPDCSESVIWTLLAEPLEISSKQLKLLRQIRSHEGVKTEKNYRPLQPLNGRRIQYRSSTSIESICSSSSEYQYLLPFLILTFIQFSCI